MLWNIFIEAHLAVLNIEELYKEIVYLNVHKKKI